MEALDDEETLRQLRETDAHVWDSFDVSDLMLRKKFLRPKSSRELSFLEYAYMATKGETPTTRQHQVYLEWLRASSSLTDAQIQSWYSTRRKKDRVNSQMSSSDLLHPYKCKGVYKKNAHRSFTIGGK